jgi:Fur family peroxide stress response transcriptional regulator
MRIEVLSVFRTIPNTEPSPPGPEIEARIIRELQAAGLKATAPRRAIVRELMGDTSHPTAQQLYERLRAKLSSLSFATVYNTLRALGAVGQVGRLELGGATRFDPNVAPHHHAVCDRCGSVQDVPMQRAPRKPELTGFAVERVEYVYRGVCSTCREGSEADAT